MKRRSSKGFFLIMSFVVLALSGCASGPRASRGLAYTTVSIAGAPYIALPSVCERERISWDYDALSKVVVLKKDNKVYRLLVGSNRMLADGQVHQLSAPVTIKDSIVYVSADFMDFLHPVAASDQTQPMFHAPVFLRQINSVILDAGHGGKDPGAIGKRGLREKDVVLDVTNRLYKILEAFGLKVYRTRSEDVFIPLPERSLIANKKQVDLFISIHANANKSRWIEGFEVYYLTEDVDDDARALAAGENAPLKMSQDLDKSDSYLKAIVWDLVYTENRKESIELARYICESVSNDLKLNMNGVRGAPFAVLKGAQMPAVLVEIGYISNKEGEKKLKSSAYRQKMAESIARGILGFRDYAQGP
ncbi:MAG: N-acetylmuramoyl-L-alanine amidase [Candidatus Omnitrophota bacterium]